MIDISKMKALAARLRGPINKFDNTAAAYSESAQAIEDLLSELEAREALMIDMRNAMNNGLFWAEVPELRERFEAQCRAPASEGEQK